MTLTLRPPRVVVLFRGGNRWREWARLAITAASRVWGAAGFVYVPFDQDGQVDSRLLEVVRRYDPDYIAIASHRLAEWLRLEPEALGLPEDFDLEQAKAVDRPDVDDRAAHVAATAVIAACTPLAMSIRPDSAHWYRLSSASAPSDPLLAVPIDGDQPAVCLAASEAWDGDVALWACTRTGLSTDREPRPQPSDVDLLRWLIMPSDPPDELLRFTGLGTGDTAAGKPTWFEAVSPDVAMIFNGLARDNAAVVIGDTADDFALAVLLDRMLGFALWLTEATLENEFRAGWRPQSALSERLRVPSAAADRPVTSLSLSADRLTELLPVLLGHFGSAGETSSPWEPDWAVREPVLNRGGLAARLIQEHLGTTITTAVTRDEDGTLAVQSPIASPIPVRPRLSRFGNPAWLLDIAIDASPMPEARRLPADVLLADAASDVVMIRSGRDGITVHAASFGFVMGGTVLTSRLARPRPRFLGMRSWVTAQAARQDLHVRSSRPGINADLLSRRLGGRARLREVVNGPLLAALRDLSSPKPPRSNRTAEAFPDGGGVLLAGSRFLTMEALRRLTPDETPEGRRDAIDELLRARLMRQGLVLDCQECATLTFVGIDDLAQRYTCARCGAENDFAAARWRQPVEEPVWYYDLHPTARDLIGSHGDVPLLAAEQLRASSRRYADTGELEFLRPKGAKPEFEIDLITLTDDGVTVVEAKSNGSLGSGKELDRAVSKRFRAASAIGADRVVFARSSAPWSQNVVDRVSNLQATRYPHIEVGWIGDLA